METCLFTGQCTESDKKYVTVAALRGLIARDCPIKNAGPCPKVRSTPLAVAAEPCVCPVTPATALTIISESPVCQCPTSVPCPSSELLQTVTTASTCESDLRECQQSLTFTDTSKAGAQTSRQDWEGKYIQSQLIAEGINFTKVQYQNRSKDLSEEVRKCLEKLGAANGKITELNDGWRSANSTLLKNKLDETNITKSWDQCLEDKLDCEVLSDERRVNLTVVEGLLEKSLKSDSGCQGSISKLNERISGIKSLILIFLKRGGGYPLLLKYAFSA